MSLSKSLVSFPSGSLCAAVALACSLAACGGGGGSTDAGHQPERGAVSRSSDAAVSQQHQPNQSLAAGHGLAADHPPGGTPSQDVAGAVTDAFQALIGHALSESLDEMDDHRFVGGQVIDPFGRTHTAGQWLQHVQQNCPGTAAAGFEAQQVSMAHIGCLAGTYVGRDPDTDQACRVTLAQDGSVSVLHQGSDRPLMRLSADNARYSYGETVLGGPDLQQLILSGRQEQSRPDRRTALELEMGHGMLLGRTVRVLNILYDDTDLTGYRPVVEGVDHDFACMLMVDIGQPAR